jgi:demethylmenaquinone methyltransferase/2-methoxy-6-polyprenyl-1,4-benzoquinol methylase
LEPSPAAHAQKVRDHFTQIARRYDLANHLLSFGLDFFWRRRVATIVKKWNPDRLLDVATGSGDLALAIQRESPLTQIIGTDFCESMLDRAHEKGLKNLVIADALALPFEDASFDAVTVAFGLRNILPHAAALREMARVLSPDGRLLVLDFSQPIAPLRIAYRFYLHRCLPKIAEFVTGSREAYEYLGSSIETFPHGGQMKTLLLDNGFTEAKSQPLTGGIVSIYTARRSVS